MGAKVTAAVHWSCIVGYEISKRLRQLVWPWHGRAFYQNWHDRNATLKRDFNLDANVISLVMNTLVLTLPKPTRSNNGE
jgi:hypothetical protein